MKKLLVLGATGIIGKHLCTQAAEAGWTVTGVSRHGATPEMGVTHVTADVRSPRVLAEQLQEEYFDTAVDLVSFTVDQLRNTVDAIGERVQHYVFVSSATVFADPAPGEFLNEDSEMIADGWSYAKHKIECEQFLAGAASSGLAATIVRPYITYSDTRIPFGIWEASDVLDRLRRGRPVIIGSELEENFTTLTHASDVAAALIDIIGSDASIGMDINIAHGPRLTWQQVYAAVAASLGVELSVAHVPVARIREQFPALSGKISDRMRDRRFDSRRVLSLSPHAHDPVPFENAVRNVVNLRKWGCSDRSMVDEGKLDRLITEHGPAKVFAQERRSYARQLLRTSPTQWIKYSVGYHPALSNVRDAVRVKGLASSSGNYGISH